MKVRITLPSFLKVLQLQYSTCQSAIALLEELRSDSVKVCRMGGYVNE